MNKKEDIYRLINEAVDVLRTCFGGTKVEILNYEHATPFDVSLSVEGVKCKFQISTINKINANAYTLFQQNSASIMAYVRGSTITDGDYYFGADNASAKSSLLVQTAGPSPKAYINQTAGFIQDFGAALAAAGVSVMLFGASTIEPLSLEPVSTGLSRAKSFE